MDSLAKNEITLLGGPPGSGKTYLALGYLFSLLERGKINRIVIFCNPVVARNAAKLGYYPGS
jgi:phosphate starvation-inducible protein PhoH